MRRSPRRVIVSVTAAVVALLLLSAGAALALPPAPAAHWLAISQPAPTDFHPGDSGDLYEVIVVNDGGTASTGPVTVTDKLPRGVLLNEAKAFVEEGEEVGVPSEFVSPCEQSSEEEQVTVTCTTEVEVGVGRQVILNLNVQVPGSAAGELSNTATVSGGGAPTATATNSTPVTPESQPIPYGAAMTSELTDANGAGTQAGSHPFAFTSLVAFNIAAVDPNLTCNLGRTTGCSTLNAQARDIEVALPAGLVGNPTAVPYCTQQQFEQNTFRGCPVDTQVGSLFLYFYGNNQAQYAPVYNIEPPPDQPAELGFSVSTLAHIAMFFHVRSDGDYGLTADIGDINQFAPVRVAALSIWGVPGDVAHDPLRASQYGNCGRGCPSGLVTPKPFLTRPTSCTGTTLPISISGDSWQNPLAPPFEVLAGTSLAGMTGCEALSLEPTLDVAPSTHSAGVPVGYNVHLGVPQKEELEGVATPDIRDAEVTFPEGTVISPSAANGLVACSDAQFALKSRVRGSCPRESKIGTIKITTSLLATPLLGSLFVGQPECSPCSPAQTEAGQMLHVLFEAEGSGVVIKLSGHTKVDQATGRLTAVFTDNPQLPFSDLEVALDQGPAAPLVNPSACGAAIASASLTPWSSSLPTQVSAPPISIEGCTPTTFAPGFEAGTTSSAHAGSFSALRVSVARQDGEPTLGRVSVTTPPGLLGVLKGVARCTDAQAAVDECPEASRIGSDAVTVGAGTAPLTLAGGKVYLTGPYAGQPFGLAIVTPAQAGPFVLAGNTGRGSEVVRAAIAIDPSTAAITVTSDQLPQELNGIPLAIRKIDVNIDRSGFIFNPTNCNAMTIRGAITSASGVLSGVASTFQAVNCATLPFKPKFTASTRAKATKANGAYLRVKVVSGPGQANIRKVKVDLPKQLPSRLTTLQKACLAKVFETNPASCPAASAVGQATALTPVLASPLSGPAYLVSHGGAAFPDLEIVLQGEGITLVLDGHTDIKHGITTSTFNAVPDAPVTSFDLVLPQGPHSVLAAFGSLCRKALNMPTAITGQNGAVLKQTTRIVPSGCPRHKQVKRKRSAARRKG